jgi:sugar diacid utilization regulator
MPRGIAPDLPAEAEPMRDGTVEDRAGAAATLVERARELQSKLELQRRLTQIAVTETGWTALVEELERLTGLRVAVGIGGEQPPSNALPIVIAREDLGWVALEDGAPPPPDRRELLEHLASLIGLELVRDRAAFKAEWELRGDLLDELLREETPSASAMRRAAQLGVELHLMRRVVVLEPAGREIIEPLVLLVRRALRDIDAANRAIAGFHGPRVAVALPDDVDPSTLVARLRQLDGTASAWLHAGTAVTRTSLRAAAREAEVALGLAQAADGDPQRLVRYEEFGPLRFMLDAHDTSQMVEVVEQYLGDLAMHDRLKRSDLLTTLEVFLETGGHHKSTAERCHIHGSTVKYRLGLIRNIVGRPLSDPEVRFELGIAFAVRKVLSTIGVQTLARRDDSSDATRARGDVARPATAV